MKEAHKVVRRHSEVTVYKPKGAEHWYYRVKFRGKRFNRTTGQANKTQALIQARLIAKSLREGGEARELMARPGYATAGQVVKVWLERQQVKSRKGVAAAYARVVRRVAADWEGVSIEKVSGKVFEEHLAAYAGSPKGRHSLWAAVRSMYQEDALRWYRQAGLRLPEAVVKDFRGVRSGGTAGGGGFIPIAPEVLERMDRHADRLRRSGNVNVRRVWLVYYLMRWAGLRNQEVLDLRWRWVDVSGEQPLLWFKEDAMAGYVPKGKPGAVPLRADRLALIVETVGRDGEFVLPRRTKTEAQKFVQRHVNRFVRRFLPGRQKGAYELRKQFGSEVAARYDLTTASKWLRHGSLQTTLTWYHGSINQQPAL